MTSIIILLIFGTNLVAPVVLLVVGGLVILFLSLVNHFNRHSFYGTKVSVVFSHKNGLKITGENQYTRSVRNRKTRDPD